MLNYIIIAILIGWVVLAIKYLRKHKSGCDGNCLSCHKTSICESYRKDYPKESR